MNRRLFSSPRATVKVLKTVWRHPGNSGGSARAIARLLWAELRARVTGKPVLVGVGADSRIWAYLHQGGSWRAVRSPLPDYEEMSFWRTILRPDDWFMDVGAHVGLYSLIALECGAKVICVEPQAEMMAQLEANLRLNDAVGELHTVALADAPGELQLAGHPDPARRSLVDSGSPYDGFTVEVRTLDRILGERSLRGLKIDVEGWERLVLEGGARALEARRIDAIQLEWNDCSETTLGEGRDTVARLLISHGYRLFRPVGGEPQELDTFADGTDVFALSPSLCSELGLIA